MTLYLVGKSLDSNLVFASDGFCLEPNLETRTDSQPKVFPVTKFPDTFIAMAGCTSFGILTARIIEAIHDQFSQHPKEAISGKIHHTYANLDENPWLLEVAEAEGEKVKKGLSDIDFYSKVNIYSFRGADPVVTKLLFTMERPYMRYLGFDSSFDFPYHTGGRNDVSNEILAELWLRDGNLLSASNLKYLFCYILSETQDRRQEVRGDYFFGELVATNQGGLVNFGPRENHSKAIETGRQLAEKLREKQLRASPDLARKAVQTLEDLDVLRRLCDKRLIEVEHSQGGSENDNQLALFLLEQYLNLIPSEGLDYRLQVIPIIIEPQMGNVVFYESILPKFEGKKDIYYCRFVGRAKVCLADQTQDSQQSTIYTSAIPLLERVVRENDNGVDRSWLGKAYSKIGRVNEAEAIFQQTLDEYAKRYLTLPQQLAVVRSLKGMFGLGKTEYKGHLINYAAHIIKKGSVTKEMVKKT